MRAIKTLTLYRPSDKSVIAEIYEGEEYNIPNTILVFEGTNSDFLELNNDYSYENDIDIITEL